MKNTVLKLTAITLCTAVLATAQAQDRDDNAPGWRGGPGTNWENPPGRRGGPGASPDPWAGMSRAERQAWHERQRENIRKRQRLHAGNPPGPIGGPGRGPRWDRDHNPPGWRGGPGTNWENPPGWRGGPGASPDRGYRGGNPPGVIGGPGYGRRWDRDNNPPGWRGGPGTNWENPPGRRGGRGTSPD